MLGIGRNAHVFVTPTGYALTQELEGFSNMDHDFPIGERMNVLTSGCLLVGLQRKARERSRSRRRSASMNLEGIGTQHWSGICYF